MRKESIADYQDRNTGVDIIRGICILAVILLHLNIHLGISSSFLKEFLPRQLFSLLFWSGYYGVVIFFTLSGYLITLSIKRKWRHLNQLNIKTFYWYRFSRIIPLLLVVLVSLAILHLLKVPGFYINPEQTSLTRALFSALTFHINWLEIQVGYLPANWDILWSISIEETFYLIFPLACIFLKKEWHFIFITILFLVVSPWCRVNLFAGNELADKNHLAYIDSLALGCITAIFAEGVDFPKWLLRAFMVIGCAMVITVVYFRSIIYQSGLTNLGLNVTILSCGMALILQWLHISHKSGTQGDYRFLGWLKKMGLYSYEIYLTHMFVVISGAAVFRYFGLGAGYLLPFCISIIILSYVIGKVVFTYFSEPVNVGLRRYWKEKNLLPAGRGNEKFS